MSQQGQVDRAKRDLAGHLHIDESSIVVKSVRATQWSDASLGVGSKGGDAFAMVLIDGYVIELQAQGRTYTYHADEDKRVVRA